MQDGDSRGLSFSRIRILDVIAPSRLTRHFSIIILSLTRDSRGDRPSPGFPMFEATKSVILIPFRAKSELRGNANAIDSRGFSPHWPAQRTLKKSARSPSLTGCVFNHLRFRKKKVPREKALRRR